MSGVVIIGKYLPIFGSLNPNSLKIESLGVGASAYGKKDSIIDILALFISLFVGDNFSTLLIFPDAERNCISDKLCSLFLHVITYFVCYLLVKASQENWTYHHSYIDFETVHETSALKSNIWSTHNQHFPRMLCSPKYIIRCNWMFFSSWDIRIGWSATCRDKDFVSSDQFNLAFWIFQLKSICRNKSSQFVEILNLFRV